jgi:hypothetical protein
MLKVRTAFFATDLQGNEVFVQGGTQVSEITDAGPAEGYTAFDAHGRKSIVGWNVSFRIKHPSTPWDEIVTVDAVKLLKAMEGQNV